MDIKINYTCDIAVNNKNPNLKFSKNLENPDNNSKKLNSLFEVFQSYKDKLLYIIVPSCSVNFINNIDILSFNENKFIKSLKGHNNEIVSLKYLINPKNNNEYLVSSDLIEIIIIWDISNNYIIKNKINPNNIYSIIYSKLLIFNSSFVINSCNNFIITSGASNDNSINDNCYTKIYMFDENCAFIKNVNNSNNYNTYFLLEWKYEENDYLIECANNGIYINNLNTDEIYSFLECEYTRNVNHYEGILFNLREKEYLICTSENGYIVMWDLINKYIFNVIYFGSNCQLFHIISWNDRYIIVNNYTNNSINIVDIKLFKIICCYKLNKNKIIENIKKIKCDIYSDSLLISFEDNNIQLWT